MSQKTKAKMLFIAVVETTSSSVTMVPMPSPVVTAPTTWKRTPGLIVKQMVGVVRT